MSDKAVEDARWGHLAASGAGAVSHHAGAGRFDISLLFLILDRENIFLAYRKGNWGIS